MPQPVSDDDGGKERKPMRRFILAIGAAALLAIASIGPVAAGLGPPAGHLPPTGCVNGLSGGVSGQTPIYGGFVWGFSNACDPLV